MLAAERVLRSVAVGRAVTTKSGAARLTSAQVHPSRANLDAFLALPAARELDLRNRFYVCATFRSHNLSLLSVDV